MVDIVNGTNALTEVDEIADSSEDIIEYDVLGNEFVSSLLDILFYLVSVCGIFEYLAEHLEGNLLVDAVLLCIEVNIAADIYHSVADDLSDPLDHLDVGLAALVGKILLSLYLYESVVYTCLLDLASLVVGNSLACLSHDLACHRIDHRLCKEVSRKT